MRASWNQVRTTPIHVFVLILAITLLGGCRASEKSADNTSPASADRAPGAPAIHSYSTTFPKAENPVNENGNWNGGSLAETDFGKRSGESINRLWGNVQTVPGMAFGVDEPTEFGDPTAILTGTWGQTQTATANVKVNKTPRGACCHEVEVRLRTTISDRSITGYEGYCSVMPSHPYCHIARWNGPDNSYWNLEKKSVAVYFADGDVMKATATGANPVVITLYKNGVSILQAVDTGAAGGGFGAYGPFPSGNPGVGFYDNHDNNWKDFGLSSFTATDDPSAAAAPASAR